MKAIHNPFSLCPKSWIVVLYLKDTEKWKQFTTIWKWRCNRCMLCCISKIQKNESNSQLNNKCVIESQSCVVSQRYRKMKAIHNIFWIFSNSARVVLYLKDTEKWKQFTTRSCNGLPFATLCCISKIQKNESNSQLVLMRF